MTLGEKARAEYVRAMILDRLRRFPDGLTAVEIARGAGLKRAETERGLNSLRRSKQARRHAEAVWMAGAQ